MALPEIVARYLDAYNRRDAEELIDCVADDVVFENVANAGESLRIEGREAFAGLARQAAAMFASRRQSVRTAVVSGDQVALEIDWTGVPAVDAGRHLHHAPGRTDRPYRRHQLSGGRPPHSPPIALLPRLPYRAAFLSSPCPGASMSRRRQIYEGKAKILYEGPEPGTLIQYFKDDATAFNAQKKGTISGKGVLNNRISEHIFTLLGQIGIPHHFIRRVNMREQLIRQVEIVPIEVVVRNVAAGSLSKRLGIEEGVQLPRTIIEYYYKDDALGDPLIADEHIACFGWASQEEMNDIADMAVRVNDFLCGLFAAIGIRLVDFKLEFGRLWENDYSRIILADEISPDGCRLWDMSSGEKLDKDRFRRDLGGEAEAYQEVARRLGLLPEGDAANMVLDMESHRKKRGK
jgi:phosphoribosylaminoimidazole-succinocarboxamide synthase